MTATSVIESILIEERIQVLFIRENLDFPLNANTPNNSNTVRASELITNLSKTVGRIDGVIH